MIILLVFASNNNSFAQDQTGAVVEKKKEIKEKKIKEKNDSDIQEKKSTKKDLEKKQDEFSDYNKTDSDEVIQTKDDEKKKSEIEAERKNKSDKLDKEKKTVNATRDEVKKNKGNAYGKNKEDLTGREFGLTRAEDAKNKLKTKQAELTRNKAIVSSGRSKIIASRKRIAEEKEKGEITEAQYLEKTEKIAKIEEWLNKFEATINAGEKKYNDQKVKLSKIYSDN